MFPQFYQRVFETRLNPRQYLVVNINVTKLPRCQFIQFPQPIKYESRVRNLQRFLDLPQLSAKLLWFPIIKQLLKQEFRTQAPNRKQQRRTKKFKLIHQGYLFLILDRTRVARAKFNGVKFSLGKTHNSRILATLTPQGKQLFSSTTNNFNAGFTAAETLPNSRSARTRISQCSTGSLAQAKENRALPNRE